MTKSLWLLLSVYISSSYCQVFVCPNGWLSHEDRCYKFVFNPMLPYSEASRDCQRDGAILLTINDQSEHQFVLNRLRNIDFLRQEWYTSGEKDHSTVIPRYVWTATNVEVPGISYFWIDNNEPYKGNVDKDVMAYVYDYLYGRYAIALVGDRKQSRPYICEISRNEVYRINIVDRGFDYGVPFTDIHEIKRGPKFTIDAKDTIILGDTPLVYLECIATAVPQPTYEWYQVPSGQVVSAQLDPRFTITNGRLTIQSPQDLEDTGMYQCMSSNTEGTIMGSPVSLSFASLGEFSNVNAAPVTPDQYQGAVIECPTITSRQGSAIRYQWIKDSVDAGSFGDFIRPDLNNYLFISGNGKLYFSEVTSADDGTYRCVATLTSINQNDNYVGASQTPSRTSRGIELRVKSNPGGTYDPKIVDSFINVVPGTPVEGMDVSLECFAYGTTPLMYYWDFPKWDVFRYSLTDSNRVLKINNVTLDDSGIFNCTVRNGRGGPEFDKKTYAFYVEAKPRFLLPLQDQHLDIGTRQLTWRCEARAVPFPTYSWYKDGAMITNSSDGKVFIHKNTLHIMDLDKERDEGMYQCAAKNSYGEVFTTGQLRILTIAPQFNKYPMSPTMSGANGGNVTIPCMPEAAPFPEFTWLKNGGSLNPSTDPNSRIHITLTGDLVLQGLTEGDQGWYECKVMNEYGEASDRTYLNVYQKTTIFRNPTPIEVAVNTTGYLFCQASYNVDNLDLVYQWAFNNRLINFERNPHFRQGTGQDNEGGLYLIFAQFENTGRYTCIARTQVDSANYTTTILVYGPPSEPAGVLAYKAEDVASDPLSNFQAGVRDVVLRWFDPVDTHGAPIDSYIVYGKTNFSDAWVTLMSNIPHPATVIPAEDDPQRRQYLLRDLKPGVSYQFRLRAVNRYGVGDQSSPTRLIVIPGDRPIKAPDHVGGGGGSVGTLRITWTPLHPEDHNGWGIGYKVEWREKPGPGQENSNIKWNTGFVQGNVGEFSHTVGQDNYYLPYNVKVTPFNIFGEGPSGSNDTVFSAEDLPIGVPSNVYAEPFNESAIIVYWDPIEDNRLNMKGRLKGYKVNYWLKDVQDITEATQAIFYGNRDHAMIIGLLPDTFYTVSVIVFNNAGNGLKSEVAHQSTDRSAPLDYPVNIEVYPHEEHSVRIRFRGLSTGIFEEPLLGYKIRYWRDTEDIRQAKSVDVEKETEGFLEDIQTDTLYHLRVLGYSVGGDGKMSSPETLFSYMKGRVAQIQWDPTTSEVIYIYHYASTAVTFTGCALTVLIGLIFTMLLL